MIEHATDISDRLCLLKKISFWGEGRGGGMGVDYYILALNHVTLIQYLIQRQTHQGK